MNDHSLTVFQYKQREVRTVTRNGEPWFVAKDLCGVLEISKHRDAISRLDDDERGSVVVDTLGGKQEMAVVSRSGMYALVLTSRKPEAKVFRKWITNEVLPSIEKTGSYSISQPQKTRHYLERVKLSVEGGSQLPDGYWCVLHESVRILFFVEEILSCPVDHADLLDGSIGKMWSKYRAEKEWAGDRVKFNYKFPDGRYCNPWCYRMLELGYFVDWVNKQYQPQHLPKYLEKKYGAIVKV